MIETGLKDKIAIVTGGAAGIGRASVQAFLAEGAKVAAWDITDPAEPIPQVHFQKVDVTKREAVESAIQEVMAKWNRIDILINNAGIVRDAQLAKMTDENFDAVIDVNRSEER